MHQAERDERIQRYYTETFDEGDRLVDRSANGRVEFQRLQRLVSERLAARSRVLDVGGATGIHARWLAEAGHAVHLVDPVPAQVAAAAALGGFRATVGDARELDIDDDAFDAVLLLGPLYHLQDRADRMRAWAEALRVLAPGGVVFGAGISRAAAALQLILAHRFENLPAAALMTLLETGGDGGTPFGRFPGGHHHTASELAAEAAEAGFIEVVAIGVEGVAGMGLEALGPDDGLVESAVRIADAGDGEPEIADLSPHLLAIARKPV